MEQVIYKNSAGKIVTFGDNAPFILTKVDGTGAVGTNIYTQKSPHQDGVSYQGNTLEPRPISLEVKILAENEGDMAVKRGQLLNVFNPKLGAGELTYSLGNITRKVSALPEIAPLFPENTEDRDFKDVMQNCLIQLYCPNPFWQDINATMAEIALWRGSFHFPLVIPKETGIIMGYREPSLIVNVLNKGDVPCGMRIQFKALATLVNPSLFNVNTREFFKINRTMEVGEIITVTTHFQNKRVKLNKNGVITTETNWDFNSTFLQLDPGDNLFRYDADEGLDNLEVSIYFNPQYLGV